MPQPKFGAAKTQSEITREQQARNQQNQENQQVFNQADSGGAGSTKTQAEKDREQQLTQAAQQQHQENTQAFKTSAQNQGRNR